MIRDHLKKILCYLYLFSISIMNIENVFIKDIFVIILICYSCLTQFLSWSLDQGGWSAGGQAKASLAQREERTRGGCYVGTLRSRGALLLDRVGRRKRVRAWMRDAVSSRWRGGFWFERAMETWIDPPVRCTAIGGGDDDSDRPPGQVSVGEKPGYAAAVVWVMRQSAWSRGRLWCSDFLWKIGSLCGKRCGDHLRCFLRL